MPDIGSETAGVGASGFEVVENIAGLAGYARLAMSDPTNQHAKRKSRTKVRT